MPYATPAELFDAVVGSRNRGDIETYLGCYESNATIVLQPGSVASGHDALRRFFDFFTALKPSFKVRRREFVEARKSRCISLSGHSPVWAPTVNRSTGVGAPVTFYANKAIVAGWSRSTTPGAPPCSIPGRSKPVPEGRHSL
jgi:hypothetical protein